MLSRMHLQNILIGAAAVLFVGTHFSGSGQSRSVLDGGEVYLRNDSTISLSADSADATVGDSTSPTGPMATSVKAALAAFNGLVPKLSHPRALEDAFRSYFAYKAAHPDEVRKPYFYFVDYGLPSSAKRGFVFDMSSLKIVEGPFTVAHGRGSSKSKTGTPTRFSNAVGSAATSLGLFLAKSTYAFSGHAGGRIYSSIGLRLSGMSGNYNDNAFRRGVVAHGAPYVTANQAGRSQGCPAMEPDRARRLLPKLADGGVVFLFAPDSTWMAKDPWASADGS
jgi:L,D-transpeptidase catalytic domain